jgi:signal transduction histidine kinase
MEYSSRWPNSGRYTAALRNERSERWSAFTFAICGLCFFAGILSTAAAVLPENTNANLITIDELQRTVARDGRSLQSFQVEGDVCAVVPQWNILVLQDASGAVLLQLPSISRELNVGDLLVVEVDHCRLNRIRYGLQVGTAPVVDNTTHATMTRSGAVFLKKGMNPISVAWFNGYGDSALKLDYEGPEIPRQPIPDSILWCNRVGGTDPENLRQGLNYSAYEGSGWYVLPDFSRLNPAASGVAANFRASYRTRDHECGLVFNGFIQIDQPGIYTFHLSSDDGSVLYAGNPGARCEVVSLGHKSAPRVASFESLSASPPTGYWTSLDGEITFVGQNDIGLELEVASGEESIQATVVGGSLTSGVNLLHRHVYLMGICELLRDLEQKQSARMIIPSTNQIQIQEMTDESNAGIASGHAVLTAVRQIRRLEPEQARKKIWVSIRGVIIQVSPTSLVLQDSTGGVFIHYNSGEWTDQPRVGDLWQIEGTTDPGDFSPVVFATRGTYLRNATLPEPTRPTWDQLINGSLDAQYVEIQGIVVSVSEAGMVMQMPDGKINVRAEEMRRYYAGGKEALVNIHGELPPDEVSKSYEGSVVRIRGCLAAVRNLNTRQIKAGEIRLVAAVVSVVDPRPVDPFVLPTRKLSDLLLFDPRASTLQRTKVAGQIVYALPQEYFIQDGSTSFRALTDETLPLRAGDYVEAVGFPQLGGPSPVLLAAQLRKIRVGPLPSPVHVLQTNLLDQKLDSTLVELEAILLSDTAHRDGRVLELQAGPYHFFARLNARYEERRSLMPGSQLQLTGVYSSARQDRVDANADPFELLLNNASDIVVLKQPSWWTVKNTAAVIAVLVIGLGTALIWATLLRRKVEERTVQLKQEIEERQLVEQHRAVEKERTRVAQDLHDELGAGLTEVSILGSLAKTEAIPLETKERYLDQLTQVARSLVTSLDEIVWAVNPHYDSAASLASYYSLFAQRFLNLAGIACRLQVADDIPEYPLDSRMRHGVFCAFKEALNNVIQHSGASEVRLVIEILADQLVLSVIDNGRGFESIAEAPGRDGLAGLARRLRELGGDCQITSQPGRGTKIEFHLPLNGIQYGQNRNR